MLKAFTNVQGVYDVEVLTDVEGNYGCTSCLRMLKPLTDAEGVYGC